MSAQCSERARVTTGDLILRVLGQRPSRPQRVPCALLPDLLATAPLPSGFPFAPFLGARPRLGLGRRLLLSASSLSCGLWFGTPPSSFCLLPLMLPLVWDAAFFFLPPPSHAASHPSCLLYQRCCSGGWSGFCRSPGGVLGGSGRE